MKKKYSLITQQNFEKYAKSKIWMHFEQICEKKLEGVKTSIGNKPIAEVIDFQFGL